MLAQPLAPRLLTLLRELAFAEREVVLSSGRRSNFYIDCKQVTLHPEGAWLLGQVMLAEIERVALAAVAVGGLTMGADPIATAVSIASYQAGRPRAAFLVRKEPKGHGTGVWIECPQSLRQGSPEVVIVEDVITTGASTLKAIERVREAGWRVLGAVAIVDRDEGGREAIAAEVPVTSLFRRQDFLP